MVKPEQKSTQAKNAAAWRKWLEKNHEKETCVWLLIHHKDSGVPSVYYAQAVEEALCFGWIDSRPNKRDDKSYYLFFAKRKPKSRWSKINRQRVSKLARLGKITAAGLAMVNLAKKTGTWSALDHIDNMVIPSDLMSALTANKKAHQHFDAFPPSSKKIILEWISNAKRAETRTRRIDEAVKLAARNVRANHYKR